MTRTGGAEGNLRAAALSYAERGWHVFPCVERGKTPATPHGFKDATTDSEIIENWWHENPNYNVAVACGPSNLFVLDVDAHEPDVGLGFANFCALLTEHNADPQTREHATPSGGLHCFFEGDGPSSASKIAAQIDTRGRGGYVLMPPSVTDDGVYEVERDNPLEPVPGWLLELVAPRRMVRQPVAAARRTGIVQPFRPSSRSGYARAALDNEARAIKDAAVGTRNDTLVRAAFNIGQLVATGELDAAASVSALLTAALTVGLDEHEAEATIASGLSAGMHHPRGAA